ncbi:MAG: S-layer protein [Subdoligranulum sp.]|nr:S-layer protein [Subdoligranulum sp.]
MKKTTIRSALAVLLAASTLTACGGSAASSAPASAAASSTAAAPAKQYTIGIAEAQANDETTVRRAYLENYIGPAYNVKFIFSEVLKDDAATKTFIENCADADAIIDFKSMSGQMCQICADNDMVYAISDNYIAHPEFLETDYPNFAGAVGSNNAELGSLFGTWLKDNVEADGTEGYLIATGIASSGNQQHIEIGQGILNGIADKYGLTFEQDIADLVTVAETTNAANDNGILVTWYPGSPNKESWLPGVSALIQTGQYNTFLSAGQTYNQSATVVDEVEKSFGIDIKVASVGALGQTLMTAFNTKDTFGNPSIDLATVKSTSVLTSALFAITYNALNGDVQTACRGTDGKPLYFEFANMSVTSAEQLAQMNGWDDASTGNWCATTDVVDGMLTIVNPDLTAEEINTYLGTLDFETLKSMMG